MSQYAKNTEVSSEKTRYEIERTLMRYGAENFIYANTAERALVGFLMSGRQIKFVLPLPRKEEFRLTDTGRVRTTSSQMDAWEQACRQRWRALNLVIKAKLEAVETGISEFDNEFMANIVLPDGATVGEFMRPQIEQAYLSGKVPSMLPMLEDKRI